MKLFAHRGWSAGVGENTIEAFKKSVEASIDGIELDIRYGKDGKSVVVAHNHPKSDTTLTLIDALGYLKQTNLELLIEFKHYSDEFFDLVTNLVRNHKMEDRVIFFAFPHIATKFPWHKERAIKLGIIALLPQHIKKYHGIYKPDMVLIGWGDRLQRFIFKTFWSVSSLSKVIQKNKSVKFVVGVAYGKKDVSWLGKQAGIYAFTIDNPDTALGK